MVATLKDVAVLAGVSTSAVSRTFTDGAPVSAAMRAKVERAAADLGYHPNFLAASLTTGRTKLIGLVSNSFDNPVFLQVFDLVTRALQDRGLRPLLVNLSDETDPAASVSMLQRYSVDGVLVVSPTLPPAFIAGFAGAGMPVVHAFGRKTDAPLVPVVGVDDVAAGRMAARELIARGYKRIGYLGGPQGATTTQDRLDGFRGAINRHRDVTLSISYASAYSFEAGRAKMQRLLENAPAEAYFCGDDMLSIGALSALTDAGLSVPGDVGIIGFNDLQMAGWANIGLTTIHQPFAKIIAAAVDLVVALAPAPQTQHEARVFPCHVISRRTLRDRA